MTSTSEVGHAKTLANFEDLIASCKGYDASYNPSKPNLQLKALDNLLTTARANLDNVIKTNTAYNNSLNARVVAFEGLRKLGTKLVNALEATDATKPTLNDAKGFNAKLQGKKSASVKTGAAPLASLTDASTPAPENHKTISSSQQSFDNRVEHFAKLINVLATEPSYTPNEVPLQIATLNNQLTELKNSNTNVINAYTTLSNARIARDKSLYSDKTGICDIAQDVKNYIKSIYGATAPEYKQVSNIPFRKPKVK